jgi:hypothetical protein
MASLSSFFFSTVSDIFMNSRIARKIPRVKVDRKNKSAVPIQGVRVLYGLGLKSQGYA